MKKTNKPNPLKFFNDNKAMAYKKAGGEMAKYKKSLKRFQGEGDSEVNMMVNKPGSTGGYKKPSNPLAPYAGNMATLAEQMSKSASSSRNNVDIANQQALSARSAAIQGSVIKPSVDRQRVITLEPPIRESAMINNIYSRPSNSSNTVKGVVAGEQVEYTPEQLKAMGIQKRGGAVKTKKRK